MDNEQKEDLRVLFLFCKGYLIECNPMTKNQILCNLWKKMSKIGKN